MAKGSAFERKMCKLLSLWWTDGDRDDVFWRSSNSGGRATERTKKGQTTRGQHGDIVATDPIGDDLIKVLTIECKNGYEKHTIMNVLDAPNLKVQQTWSKWIETAKRDAERNGSYSWILIHQRKGRKPIVAMPSVVFSMRNWKKHNDGRIEFHIAGESIMFVTLDFFLTEYQRNIIQVYARARPSKKRKKGYAIPRKRKGSL